MDIQFDIDGELAAIDDLQARLNNPLQTRALKQMVAQIEQEHGELVCALHNEPPAIAIIVHGDKIGARVSACCQDFVDLVQTQIKPVLAAAAALSSGVGVVSTLDSDSSLSGKILHLVLSKHNQKSFEFDINRIDRLTIGRLDTETGHQPDIDLAAYDAQESGVSRHHATLVREQNAMFLIDEGGPNGTWINDQRLIAKQPYALHDGDTVYFGRLGLRIFLANQSVAGNA